MKTAVVITLILLPLSLFAQNLGAEYGLGYTFMAPMGTMQKNIRQGHGFTLDFYLLPKNSRFAGGLEVNYTVYGYDKSRQVYSFSDGSTAPMDIIVNNNIVSMLAGGRYYLRDENIFRPYVALKGGYSLFTTNLNIYDPADWDHCEPVDRDLLLRDGAWVVSAGGGFQWDLSAVFKKLNANFLLFNMSVNLVRGGRADYMNTDAPSHHHPSSSDVSARFLNTQTQVVHEHHVGYVYTSFVEMVDMRAGVVIRMPGLR